MKYLAGLFIAVSFILMAVSIIAAAIDKLPLLVATCIALGLMLVIGTLASAIDRSERSEWPR